MIRYHAHGVEWSLEDLANAANVPVHSSNGDLNDSWKIKGRGGEWYGGFKSEREAMTLMAKGWSEGARKLEGLVNEISVPAARSRKRVSSYADQGDDLNVDRALVGNWDQAWRTTKRQWTRGPQHIDLVSMWGGNCVMTAEQLFWQGATATVCADILEQAGYSVRIVAAQSFEYSGNEGVLSVVIKESHEPSRVDAMAAVMCHAGIFRTLGFRGITSLPFHVGGCLAYPARSWEQRDTRTKMIAAGEWTEETVLLGQTLHREACIEEINRLVSSLDRK